MVAMTISIGFSIHFFFFKYTFPLNYKLIEFNLTQIARMISPFFLKQNDLLTILPFLNLGVTTLD